MVSADSQKAIYNLKEALEKLLSNTDDSDLSFSEAGSEDSSEDVIGLERDKCDLDFPVNEKVTYSQLEIFLLHGLS